jgi:hypothetical protein
LGKHGKISIEDAKLFFEKETFPHGWQKHPLFGVRELYSAVTELKHTAQEIDKQKQIKDGDT